MVLNVLTPQKRKVANISELEIKSFNVRTNENSQVRGSRWPLKSSIFMLHSLFTHLNNDNFYIFGLKWLSGIYNFLGVNNKMFYISMNLSVKVFKQHHEEFNCTEIFRAEINLFDSVRFHIKKLGLIFRFSFRVTRTGMLFEKIVYEGDFRYVML